MPEFILDTDGKVEGQLYGLIKWQDLDNFTQGYIEAMFFTNEGAGGIDKFWTAEYQHRLAEGQADGELPRDVGFADLDPKTLERIIRNCKKFQETPNIAGLLERAYAREGYDQAAAGRDFWYTRNGHGVGYWDRKELEDGGLGNELSELVGWGTPWGEVDVYFGHDNKVHQS